MVQLHTHDARTFNTVVYKRRSQLYRYYCKNPLLPQMFREVFAPEVRVVQLITR